jgi:hypothetical protein
LRLGIERVGWTRQLKVSRLFSIRDSHLMMTVPLNFILYLLKKGGLGW